MEESDKNRFTPGGNPEMVNPPTSLEVAEPQSDSGGGSLLLDHKTEPTVKNLAVEDTPQKSSKIEIVNELTKECSESASSTLGSLLLDHKTDPAVSHLAVEDTPQMSSEIKNVNDFTKECSGSTSSLLGGLQIDLKIDDEFSSKGSIVEAIGLDIEKGAEINSFKSSETNSAGIVKTKRRKRERTAEKKARKAFLNAQYFLRKMANKKDKELTDRDRALIKLNKKKICKYVDELKQKQKNIETISEEGEPSSFNKSIPTKNLQNTYATEESPKLNIPKSPNFDLKAAKKTSLLLLDHKTDPTVSHLAVEDTPQMSIEIKNENDLTKGCSGSTSSLLGGLQIDLKIDDEFSSKGSIVEAIGLDTDKGVETNSFMSSETNSAGIVKTKRGKKEQAAEKKARKAFRNAQYFLKKMANKKDEELTDRDRALIKLNKKKICKYEDELKQKQKNIETISEEGEPSSFNKSIPIKNLQNTYATEESPKSNIPISPNFELKAAKRISFSNRDENVVKKAKFSKAFDSPEDCQIAVIDRSHPGGKMSVEKWMKVESKILLAIAETDSGSGDEVDFNGAGWHKGVKVIRCGNRKSRDFLTQVIRDCDNIWPGAKLEVVPKSHLRVRNRISVWVPPPVPSNDETILKIIEKQNKILKTQNWKVISSTECNNGMGLDLVLAIDDESLKALKLSGGSIKFGLGSLKTRLPRDKDSKESSNFTGGVH
ncbi:DNA ligase 1-like [Chrysoperla carnea]|uniref:DNA ligase 1-like n=1 Tax=Chrysoperla carnea TaxID=189513 RepID=UPI001D0654CC|nr:DNA ligase 1-like [Chrysoperla carnea]XP_044729836.1 DNA ligase 1-like [Chrysoperla carnea]